MDGRDAAEGIDDDGWPVPAGVLTHALRTPLNALKGYSTLLASGELGRLAPDAADAAAEMRRAVAALERTVELLAPAPEAPTAGAGVVDLAPALATALDGAGYVARPGGTLGLTAPPWEGWQPLLLALVRMCAAEGAERIDAAAAGGVLELRAAAPRRTAGDGRLAALAARRHAAAAGLVVRLPRVGGARLCGDTLISGTGVTIFVASNAREAA